MSENPETLLRLGLIEDRVKNLESILLRSRGHFIAPEVSEKYDKLRDMVAAEFRIAPSAMTGISKALPIPTARGVLWMLCQDLMSYTSSRLVELSGQSHNSICYTVRLVRLQVHSNSDLASKIESIKQEYNKTA